MRSAVATCFALLLAAPAAAGAWLEQPGKGFAAASATYRHAQGSGRAAGQAAQSSELAYYGAYGLSQRLTLGVDLNRSANRSGHALMFARLPVLPKGQTRLAAELALGVNQRAGPWLPMQRMTLSFGRGFQTVGGRSGWLAVDVGYEHRSSGAEVIWKLDATFGLNPAETGQRPAPMLQVETSKPEGGRLTVSLIPSLRLKLHPERELIVGLEHRSGGQRSLGLRLGLWQRF